jgi:hypothetical protein
MKSTFSAAAVAAALLLAPGSLPAAEKPQVKEPASQAAVRTAKKSDRKLAAANVIAEVLGKGVALGAGESKSFDATSDFSGVERISIAVEAPSGQDVANANFRIIVWWSMPGADWFTSQDVISGEEFYWMNQGGGVVSVYGPELRIELRNDSDTPLTINQLTVYAVGR